MNKIPSQYTGSANSNPYGASQFSSGDGWMDPSIQAYQQQLTTWYQQALFAYSHLTDGSQRAIVAQELQTARSYASSYGFELGNDDSSSGWDVPYETGGYGMPG